MVTYLTNGPWYSKAVNHIKIKTAFHTLLIAVHGSLVKLNKSFWGHTFDSNRGDTMKRLVGYG